MIAKAELIDAPERRAVQASEFEARISGTKLKLEGHASVFDKGYDVAGGPSAGGWTEIVTRKAFDRTLSENPDVHLLINHEGLPLARTKSGTLQLSTDSRGLLVRADLDRRDPDVKSLEIKMERGDLDEMSFAFRVKRQSWSDDDTIRSLEEVSLHKGDVSVVNWGANPHTSVTMRSAIELLARGIIDESELAELRSMSTEVQRAAAVLELAKGKSTYIDLRSDINGPASVIDTDDALESQDDPQRGAFQDELLGLVNDEAYLTTPALAQATHDLAARYGADCVNPNADTKDIGPVDIEDDAPRSRLSLVEARRIAGLLEPSARMTLAQAREAIA